MSDAQWQFEAGCGIIEGIVKEKRPMTLARQRGQSEQCRFGIGSISYLFPQCNTVRTLYPKESV